VVRPNPQSQLLKLRINLLQTLLGAPHILLRLVLLSAHRLQLSLKTGRVGRTHHYRTRFARTAASAVLHLIQLMVHRCNRTLQFNHPQHPPLKLLHYLLAVRLQTTRGITATACRRLLGRLIHRTSSVSRVLAASVLFLGIIPRFHACITPQATF
jgi:hypothetical protein